MGHNTHVMLPVSLAVHSFIGVLGYALVSIVCLQGFLAGVECEEEEDDKDGAQYAEDDHPHHHVHHREGLGVVVWLYRKAVRLVHEIPQGPTKCDVICLQNRTTINYLGGCVAQVEVWFTIECVAKE